MKKQYFLALALLTFCYTAIAQVENKKRIEFELKEGYSNHDLAKFKEKGLLFYSKSTDKKGKERKWKIEKYSNKLILNDTKFISIPKKQYLDETYTTDTDLYMFFSDKKGAYSFFRINAKSMKINKIIGNLPAKANVYEIHIIDDMVFFDAVIKKAPMLFTLDINSEKQDLVPITLPDYGPKNLSIEDVQVIDESKEVLVYVNAYNKKEHDLYVIRFDENGEKKATFNLTKKHEMKLSSVSASYLEKGSYIYTGTYSPKSSVSSVGVYLCKTKNDEVVFFKFYKFLEFDNFLSYLPEKKRAKIEKKQKKKSAKGKEMKLSYLMASHDIKVLDGKFLYIGEAHYATYRTETYTTTSNGVTTTHTRRIFDGYRYTHATVAGFDEKGNKLWDNTFEMWPGYKPYYHKKFIASSIGDDRKLNLLFSSRNEIKSISFYGNGEVFKEENYSSIDTENTEDKVKFSYSNMEYWYDKYFITHG
ncbi:MAG: hypothetical protein HRT73_07275, partial [Flavobacteriales bacterium]|nr:hypothetical protein [Flavobacteriales bacterium]